MSFAIEAVMFDMDGLIFDTEPLYKRSWQTAAADLGHPISDGLFFETLGKNFHDCEQILIRALGNRFPLKSFRELWSLKMRQIIVVEGVAVKPGLDEMLALLDSRGIPRAVATGSNPAEARLALEQADLIERFDCIVTGDQVRRGKPAPDIYLQAARRLDVDPRACAALEDSNTGARAALAAGIATIVVPDLAEPLPEVASSAFGVVASLLEARDLIAGLLV